MKIFISNIATVLRQEFALITKNSGVILILFGAIFIYSILYSLAYKNEVMQKVPIAVIDNSNSEASRLFTRQLSASPNLSVAYQPTDMVKAKELFYSKKIYGIIDIPSSYGTCLLAGRAATVSIYADASYFLMYKQLYKAATDIIFSNSLKVKTNNLIASGQGTVTAAAISSPVTLNSVTLYNPSGGYGIYIMPAIMILILQQVIFIALGMTGGLISERGLYGVMRRDKISAITIVLGRAMVHFTAIALLAYVVFGLLYHLLGYPSRGAAIDLLLFFAPYLLSSIFLGIALSTLFKEQESPLLTYTAWSIPLLLLSGISFPLEGMPRWIATLGSLLPSSDGISGFVSIEVMGATIMDIAPKVRWLWSLSLIYLILAVVMVIIRLKKEQKQ